MALFLFSLSFLFGKFGKEPFFKSFLIAKRQYRQRGKYGYDRDPDRNAPAAERNQRSAPEKTIYGDDERAHDDDHS